MTSTFLYGGNVHANGIRQHYLRYGGKGQTVVIVPGITSPAATWSFVAERLGKVHDVYVLDVRGRGLSESGNDIDYSREAYAADVSAFVDSLGLTDYIYLGHSMGARIGFLVGNRYSKGIAKMILVDPPMAGPSHPPYPASLPWYTDSIRIMTRGAGIEEMRPFCPTWSDDHLRVRAEWLHTCNEVAVITTFDDLNVDDIHADMPHLKMPVLLMAAGKGGVITPADIDEVKSLMPDVTVRVVPAAGHMIPWDDEEDFFLALHEYLGITV